MSNVVRNGLELNGPVNIQCLIQLLESGSITQEKFIEELKATNQNLYDYMHELKGQLKADSEVKCWHVVCAETKAKRKEGDFIITK
jgi:hypothetical protein